MKLKKDATKEKLRGGFYTPEEIASFILRWGFNGREDMDILEPGCGDGVFLEQIKSGDYNYKSLTAVELDSDEARKAKKVKLLKSKVYNTDFFAFFEDTKKKYDLIIGNPPYIRYQFLDSHQKEEAEKIFQMAGLNYSKLTNAWASFVVGSSLLLKENGKLGFVLPAEILQVSHTETIRDFLTHFYNKLTIVSFKKLVFPGIQQEVVLLLCEKNNSKTHLIEHIDLKNASELIKQNVTRFKSPKKKIDYKTNKWTYYFLDQEEIDFIHNLKQTKKIPLLNEFAKVEVGITTGSNKFFTVPLSQVREYKLETYAKPLVGRSVQVPSVIFTPKDWRENNKIDARSHILILPRKKELEQNFGVLDYIKQGEEEGIHEGYKCRIRDEWQIIPSLWVSDALFIRRNNLYPKLIINNAKAYTTDTMHRVSIDNDVDLKALIASYYNSLSLAFAEICGRSHGGGVLELMPNEAENILIPYDKKNSSLLAEIDDLFRSGANIEDILKRTNKEILKKNYGLSQKEIDLAEGLRVKLSSRRLNRGKV